MNSNQMTLPDFGDNPFTSNLWLRWWAATTMEPEDFIASMTVCSNIDLAYAPRQITPVDETKPLTTIRTSWGFFQCYFILSVSTCLREYLKLKSMTTRLSCLALWLIQLTFSNLTERVKNITDTQVDVGAVLQRQSSDLVGQMSVSIAGDEDPGLQSFRMDTKQTTTVSCLYLKWSSLRITWHCGH